MNGLDEDAADGRPRCAWCAGDAEYRRYHDAEWGRPDLDDRLLFEKVCLEGFQAGLSWLTILRKRDDFRRAFRDFDIGSVARFNLRSVERLLGDATIVRHRGKIESTINNAKRAIELIAEFGSLRDFFWQYRPTGRHRPERITWQYLLDTPLSAESKAMSRELKARGWTFVGPTSMYSLMQACGVVNDHIEGCWVRGDVEREQRRIGSPA